MLDPTPSARPPFFAPGQHIGLHLTIQQLLSTGTNRSYYLANNRTPRWYTRICWSCGQKHNPPTAESCGYCQAPLTERSFLLSARLEHVAGEFHSFAALRLQHPAINSPIVLYKFHKQLLAFYELRSEAMLHDEPAPLGLRTLLRTGHTLCAALQELHTHGVELRGLCPENVLISRAGARLWDLDVDAVQPRPFLSGGSHDRQMAGELGKLLLPYTPPHHEELSDLFASAAELELPSLIALQRSLARIARRKQPGKTTTPVCAAASVVGRKRLQNEDSFGWRRYDGVSIAVIADGMGGYQSGDQASQLAIRTVLEWFDEHPPTATMNTAREQMLSTAVEIAGERVHMLSESLNASCGTTLVLAALWRDGSLVLAHIGDSRAYRLKGKSLLPLTDDHSMVGAMIATGKLTREEARVHPRANVLLQYLGSGDEVDPDVSHTVLLPGEKLILCTDGLWGQLPEHALQQLCLEESKPRRLVRHLIQAANQAGGKDNITVMVLST